MCVRGGRDDRGGPARSSRDASGVDAGDAARQMEDDVSARRVRRADPGGRLTGDGVDQDGRADLAVGRRGADADYRLGLSARRPEAYGLLALEIAYFAWVRARMGVAAAVVESPGGFDGGAALLAC